MVDMGKMVVVHRPASIGNAMKAIYLGMVILWALLGSWFLAPVIAWGLTWVLITGFRGYGQAVILASLISGVSRWVFLAVAVSCFYWLLQQIDRLSFKLLGAYVIINSVIFIVLYSVETCLCFRVLILFATNDPITIVSPEVFPEFGLAGVAGMIKWLELLVESIVGQGAIAVIYTVYLVTKFTYTCFFVIYAFNRYIYIGKHQDEPIKVFLIASVIVFTGLLGVPLSGIDEIRRGIWSFFIAYELGWMLLTIPISFLSAFLLSRYLTQSSSCTG